MKKIILASLLAISCTGIIAPTVVTATTPDTSNIEMNCTYEDDDCSPEDSLKLIPEERQPFFMPVFTALCGVTYKNAKHYNHSIQTWNSKNPTGYKNWVTKVNEGRHCYNMCSLHINPPKPSSYGFKSSYNCNEMTCTKK